METKTLDQLIRTKAHEARRQEIIALFEPVIRLGWSPHGADIQFKLDARFTIDDERGTISASPAMLLAVIRDALFARHAPVAEQAAVDAFLASVGDLHGQLDELRWSVDA